MKRLSQLISFQAGYSCIMLAALAGFESKTDKYVMQRLIRAGDINAKNKEVILLFSLLIITLLALWTSVLGFSYR